MSAEPVLKAKTKLSSLSIFFPCYNDAGTIGSLVATADMVASQCAEDYEIIVVDDASTDHSRALFPGLQKKHPHLRCVLHEKNKGYGAVIRRGIEEARKEFIFYTDGDGQYDVFDLLHFIPIINEGVDVVNGYKMHRHDPWYRIWIGNLYVVMMRFLFYFQIRDIDCDFRLMRRSMFEHVKLTRDSGVICLELVKRLEIAGYRFAEYPVAHYHRVYGHSQFFKIPRLLKTAWQIVQLWWELTVLKKTPKETADREVSNNINPSLINKR